MIEIKIDEKKSRRIQQMLSDVPKAMPKIMSRAINKTASSSKVEIARRINQQANMKITAIKKGIKVYKATVNKWQATLDLFTRRIPLIRFGAKQTKKGVVSYKISKTGGKKQITERPLPFIIQMKSGHIGVFRRETESTKRLPIRELWGPSISSVFERAGQIAGEMQRDISAKLEKNIDNQIAYILSKRKTG